MTTLASAGGRDYHNEIRAERDKLRKELAFEKTAHAELRKLWGAGNEAWNPIFKIVLDERDALRAEVERLNATATDLFAMNARLISKKEELTRERDYWERTRNKWEKSANMLEEENKCLRADMDRALSLNSINEKSASNMQVLYEGYKVRAKAAERKLAMAVEATKDSLAHLVAATSLLERGGKKATPSDKMFAQMLVDYKNAITRSRATLAEMEKNDG